MLFTYILTISLIPQYESVHSMDMIELQSIDVKDFEIVEDD